MNKEFLDWIAKNYPGRLSGKDKGLFLETLKKEPEKVTVWVRGHLMEWSTVATFSIGGSVLLVDYQESAEVVVKHFESYFAKDLQNLPA